jgi:hypothetical protein
MGYEIKLIAGEKTSDGTFLEILSVDLSKIGNGPLSKLISFAQGKTKTPDFQEWRDFKSIMGKHIGVEGETADLFGVGTQYDFVSVYDGNEKIDEDLYGDPLPAIPVLQVLSALDEEIRIDSSYRRFILAKSSLKEFETDLWSNIFVVPFGH